MNGIDLKALDGAKAAVEFSPNAMTVNKGIPV